MDGVWPLTGRDEELRRIWAAIEGSGDGSGVLVAGGAGVGKSRLASAAVAVLAKRHAVRWVTATASARTLPLGAFAQWAPISQADPMMVIYTVIKALTAGDKPVVVAVDDVHLLDDLSVVVIQQLVQRGLAKVVLTLRSTGPRHSLGIIDAEVRGRLAARSRSRGWIQLVLSRVTRNRSEATPAYSCSRPGPIR